MRKFIWQGKELKSMGEIMDAAKACKTKAEALAFKDEYRKITPHADANIGFGTGYENRDEAKRLKELFEVEHPIFKKADPTPEQAFHIGFRRGQEMKGREDR